MFMFQGAKLFNQLSTDLKEELSIAKFKWEIQDIFNFKLTNNCSFIGYFIYF